MFDLADFLVFLIPAIPIASLIWFIVCLLRKLHYRGSDAAIQKKRRFWLIVSGGVLLVLGGSCLALIAIFMMAIAHM